MVQNPSVKFKRLPYYIVSLFVLAREIGFLHLHKIVGKKAVLPKRNLTFSLAATLDLLILKETIIDKVYDYWDIGYQKSEIRSRISEREKSKPAYAFNFAKGTPDKKAAAGKEKSERRNRGGPVVVDIGAGFGDYCISYAKEHKESTVYAFEPDDMYWQLLTKNIKLNTMNNVVPYKTAVSSLKHIFEVIKKGNIDMLKIDCEGCEFSVFSPDSKTYLRRINSIAMEYHEWAGKRVDDLVDRFTTAGFYCIKKPIAGVSGTGYLYAQKKR